MKRDLLISLNEWRTRADHKPLLLRGARQVGKTHLVREFAKEHFENLVEINFELLPQFTSCFTTLDPSDIIAKIESAGKVTITPGKSLLFLDEIQECPQAIMAMRYFYEMLPNLHVIGAGSLLEFALRDANFSMPVGRVSFMFLKPLSFHEFLQAAGYEKLIKRIESATIESPLSEVEHDVALGLIHKYTQLGGMPDVLKTYFNTEHFNEAHITQTEILATYRRDFGKYANITQHKYLQAVFEAAPKHLGEQIKYAKIDRNFRSRELSQAMKDLQDAGIVNRVYSSNASGIPFAATINEKKFKLTFLDVGLAQNASGLTPEIAMNQQIDLINKGNIAEQLVGQELLAYQNPRTESELYFWARDGRSIAEVDYLIRIGELILPIEVKSGQNFKYKSLQLFIAEKNAPLGIVISSKPLSIQNNVLYLPFYMIKQLPQIISNLKQE